MSLLTTPQIALEVGGAAYLGWTSLEVEMAIDQMAGSFNLELAYRERTGAPAWPVVQGQACRVTLGSEVLITGHIDKLDRSIDPEGQRIQLSGRDATADLVDCSAIHRPGSWVNRKLEAIAAELVEPFGIPLDIVGDTGAAFRRFALQQGETVFDAIERMARYRGLVAWSTGDGRLKVGNPDSGQRAGRVTEGVNLLSGDASYSQNERFSTYLVKGQASGDDQRNGRAVAQVQGETGDPGVARYRPLLIVGEEQADSASLRRRAAWEATVRAGRGHTATLRVPGWTDDSGRVWRPGWRVGCQAPSLQLNGDFLIQRVTLSRSENEGTSTRLEVVPPEAWTQLAQREEAA